MTIAELNTILAALRLWQNNIDLGEAGEIRFPTPGSTWHGIATDDNSELLNARAVGDLAERINICDAGTPFMEI